MGLRERLQTVTQFFQKAATRGHKLRQEDERGENQAPASGEQARPQGERRGREKTAEDRDSKRASRQRRRNRRAQSGAAKTPKAE